MQQAEGLFVWVATVCDFIRDTINPDSQLRRLLGAHLPLSLPAESKMRQLYSTILQACPSEDEGFEENYQLLMGTVVVLRIPLSSNAMRALLGTNFAVPEMLTSLGVGSLLSGLSNAAKKQTIQIMHETFREFVTRDPAPLSKEERKFVINEHDRNQLLAVRVIITLNSQISALKKKLPMILSRNFADIIPRLPEVLSPSLSGIRAGFGFRIWMSQDTKSGVT